MRYNNLRNVIHFQLEIRNLGSIKLCFYPEIRA